MTGFVTRRDALQLLGIAASGTLISGTSATPARSQPAMVTRQDVNQLDASHPIIVAYKKALTEMYRLDTDEPDNPLAWTKQALIHQNFCPHGNWYFLPWHRAYLSYFERICRKLSGSPDFALPYWNWTLNPQVPATFWGAGDPLNHTRDIDQTGTISAEFNGPDVIREVMRKTNFADFASFKSTAPRGGSGGGQALLESRPHNNPHCEVGGDMCSFMSPLDPIFWLHHCNIDRIWASWNAIGNLNTSDPDLANFTLAANFADENGNSVDVRISDLYDTTPLNYQYDRLEPSPFGTPIPAGLTNAPVEVTDTFRATIDRKGEPGIPLQTDVAVPPAMLTSIEALALDANTQIFSQQPQIDSVLVGVKGVNQIEGAGTTVRLFLNCPYLQPETPINDPHYVTSFAFFLDHSHAGHEDQNASNFYFDITQTLDRLRRSGRYPVGSLTPQLMGFRDGKPISIAIQGEFEVLVRRRKF